MALALSRSLRSATSATRRFRPAQCRLDASDLLPGQGLLDRLDGACRKLDHVCFAHGFAHLAPAGPRPSQHPGEGIPMGAANHPRTPPTCLAPGNGGDARVIR